VHDFPPHPPRAPPNPPPKLRHPERRGRQYDRAAHHLKADIPGSVELNATGNATATIGGDLAASVTGSAALTVGGETAIDSAGPATLKAPTVKIDSPATTITGTLTVQGLLTYAAGMAGSGATPGGGAAAITGDIKITSGDLTADGISLKTHVHTEQGDGADTSPPH
jgi:phage baseplate assembly protein gpV